MKTKLLNTCGAALLLLASAAVADPASNPWVNCGTLANVNVSIGGCEISGKPLTNYEYGIAYNSKEVLPVVCTTWSVGKRIYNKTPYFVQSDNPQLGMNYGGFVFYKDTNATDECGSNQYRHKYWALGTNGVVETLLGGNGCYSSNMTVYCRKR